MTLDEITERGIDPALRLLPAKMDTPDARVLLLAYGLQETGFEDHKRRQLISVRDGPTGQIMLKPLGPAKSFWQAERGGGMVRGVRTHPATRMLARSLYAARGVRPLDASIWNAIERDDVLAAGLARLLIYSDPYPLPRMGDAEGAWRLYAIRTWRPGKPHKSTWPGFYQQALEFVAGQEA